MSYTLVIILVYPEPFLLCWLIFLKTHFVFSALFPDRHNMLLSIAIIDWQYWCPTKNFNKDDFTHVCFEKHCLKARILLAISLMWIFYSHILCTSMHLERLILMLVYVWIHYIMVKFSCVFFSFFSFFHTLV